MAHLIENQLVRGGKLDNAKPNKVRGWLEFVDGSSIQLNLAGRLGRPFGGQRLVFACPIVHETPEPLIERKISGLLDELAEFQIGVFGRIAMTGLDQQSRQLAKIGPQSTRTNASGAEEAMQIEWFSQNGIVRLELSEVELESGRWVTSTGFDPAALPTRAPRATNESEHGADDESESFADAREGATSPSTTDGEACQLPDLVDEDPQLLFPQALLDAEFSAGEIHSLDAGAKDTRPAAHGRDSTMFESGDSGNEPVAGFRELAPPLNERTQLIAGMFDPPIALPPNEQVLSDEQAQPLLLMLLARLALHHVSIEICEHCSTLTAYRLLVGHILPRATVDPRLATTNVIRQFSTWEYCPVCQDSC